MKYYEMHEIVYRKIKEEGLLSWSKSKSFEDMLKHGTNTSLKKLLSKRGISFTGMKVLDLGTGTGTSAFFCAIQGAEATGIDVSKTAIEIAEANAVKLDLKVEFLEGDVLDLHLNQKFDFIIDSTVLHCIVGADREKFFHAVREHLTEKGFFFFNTMISEGDMTSIFPVEYFYFENEVLWSLGISEISERKIINGRSYFPHRTLLSKENQLEELRRSGFEVMDFEIVREEGGSPCMVGLAKRAG